MLVGHESTQGKSPRGFASIRAGNFLLAANQRGNRIVSFRSDQETGRLSPTDQVVEAQHRSRRLCLRG